MRILLLVRSLGPGGAETQLAHIARGLHERGHVVQVASLYSGGAIWENLVGGGIDCLHLEKSSRWDVLSPLRRLIHHPGNNETNQGLAVFTLDQENHDDRDEDDPENGKEIGDIH